METGGAHVFPISCRPSDHFGNPPASATCRRAGQRSLPSLLPVAFRALDRVLAQQSAKRNKRKKSKRKKSRQKKSKQKKSKQKKRKRIANRKRTLPFPLSCPNPAGNCRWATKKADIFLSRARPIPTAGAPRSPNRLAPWTTANRRRHFFFLANCGARDAARPAAAPAAHPNYGLRCVSISPQFELQSICQCRVAYCKIGGFYYI